MSDQDNYLCEKHLARKWGISFRTLQKWRWRNTGPPYIKIGGRVRYSPESIKNFEEDNKYLRKSDDRSSCANVLATPNH
jgi:transposase-like protein